MSGSLVVHVLFTWDINPLLLATSNQRASSFVLAEAPVRKVLGMGGMATHSASHPAYSHWEREGTKNIMKVVCFGLDTVRNDLLSIAIYQGQTLYCRKQWTDSSLD